MTLRWTDPVPLSMLCVTVLGSAIVSLIIDTIEFFLVIAIPLAVTALISHWVRSWVPVLAVAIAYLYFMLFWLVGYLGDLVDRTFAQSLAQTMGFDRGLAKFAAYIGVWVLFVLGCEAALDRLTEKKEKGPPDCRALE